MTEYVRSESSEQPVSAGRPPAIFLFQPHTFRRVTRDRLAEWEQTMLAHFGLNSDEMPFDELKVLRGGTWSDSGPSGQICADDSDNFADDLDLDAYPPDSDELPEQTRPPAIFMLQPSSFPESGPTGSRNGSRSCRSMLGSGWRDSGKRPRIRERCRRPCRTIAWTTPTTHPSERAGVKRPSAFYCDCHLRG